MVGRYAKGLVFELDSKRGYFLLKFDPRVKFVKFHPIFISPPAHEDIHKQRVVDRSEVTEYSVH